MALRIAGAYVSDVIYAALAFIVLAQTRQRFPEDLIIPELVE